MKIDKFQEAVDAVERYKGLKTFMAHLTTIKDVDVITFRRILQAEIDACIATLAKYGVEP